jgi:hypothetical protein
VTTTSASHQVPQQTPPALVSPYSAASTEGTTKLGLSDVSTPRLTKTAGHVIVDSLVAHGGQVHSCGSWGEFP